MIYGIIIIFASVTAFVVLPIAIGLLNFIYRRKKILSNYINHIPALSGSHIRFNSLTKIINNLKIKVKIKFLNIYLEDERIIIKIKPLTKTNLDISVLKNMYTYNNALTKDADFDRLVRVKTNNINEVIFKLTNEVRKILISLVFTYYNYNFNITNNVIHFSNSVSDINEWSELFDNLLLIGDIFFNPLDLQKVIENFKKENNNIKKNILIELIKYYNSKEIDMDNKQRLTDFFEQSKMSSNNITSIYSCYALGDKEIPRLIKLLSKSNDDEIILIIDILKNHYDKPGVSDALYDVIKKENTEIQSELIKLFSSRKDKKSVKKILQVFKINNQKFEAPEELKIALVKYFGQLKVKKSVNWLIGMLSSYDIIKIEAVKALGNLDDLKAVEYLLPLTKGLISKDLKQAAKDSINKIQKKVPENFRGDLSVTDNINMGELSVLDDMQTGKLTIDNIKE